MKRALDAADIPFEIKDIRADESAAQRVVELGYSGTPVVEHPGGHFKGFNVTKIEEIKVALLPA